MEIQELVNALKQQNNLQYEGCADARDIVEAKKYLKDYNECSPPDDYLRFTEHINGIIGDNGCVLGVFPDEAYGFEDLILKNERLNRQDKEHVIVLGYNALDWLVYDSLSQKYQMRSKSHDVVFHIFDTFIDALKSMYRI